MIDMEQYGGRRAYAAHIRSRVLNALGAYRVAHSIEWDMAARLVFVCKGNICRSPYAKFRARQHGACTASFGLEAMEGAGANEKASRVALHRGIDLSDHQSTQLKEPLILRGDLIVVFEPWQMREVRRHNFSGLAGVTLLGIWARPNRPHIQDPYGRSDQYFQNCFSVIDLNLRVLLAHLAAHKAPAVMSRDRRTKGCP